MLIIFIAATVLLISTTEAASDHSYKSAMEIFEAMTQTSDAEIHELEKASTKYKLKAYSHLLKTNKALCDKMKAFGEKFLKLDPPAKKFIATVVVSMLNERKKGSQIKNIQKAFDELRKDKKACEKLLGLYPGLKRKC